ncbi:Glucose-methanol-choline oxidoreductase [Venturia nashicola]|uniref:Glucose-methanol-choline oxidoreductase n=1 Tax=Venturia nashicola TaxID=86259 RepID=A0A4Z1PCV2_9PEZI|nr:Glucose-methanol-choline oxidoreductase [Venturia nashicola]TLD35670.1 Glucose-methanol-choline oxidoreductase [Venturia nashicola]
MRLFASLPPALLAACYCILQRAQAQGPQPFTDPESGILFSQYSAPVTADVPKGGFQLGVAFPPNFDKNEYIGHLVGSRPQGKGWVAISHSPQMLDTLILLAWVHGQEVRTSFRYATNYTQPDIYSGALSFSQLAHTINKTHFTVTYRCQGCFSWNYKGKTGSVNMKAESILFGWGQGSRDPSMPSNNNSPVDFHDNGFGIIATVPSLGANPKYDSYVNVINPSKNIGQPKIIPLDPKLAGNRTSWPVGTKSNQPPPGYTPGQISVVPGRPPQQTGGAPPDGQSPPTQGQIPPAQGLPPAAPVQPQPPAMTGNPTVIKTPGAITIVGNRGDVKDKRQTNATPPPNACPPPEIPKPEGDLGAMPAIPGMPKKPPGTAPLQQPNSTVDCLPQISSPAPPLELEPPKLPVPTSSGEPPIPPPVDDLGLTPKTSGVPKKPPRIGKIECGSLYEVQGTLRYIC